MTCVHVKFIVVCKIVSGHIVKKCGRRVTDCVSIPWTHLLGAQGSESGDVCLPKVVP